MHGVYKAREQRRLNKLINSRAFKQGEQITINFNVVYLYRI